MTFRGVISGSGAVSQIGSGVTILTADSPYTAGLPTRKPALTPCPFFSPSVWGRFFGETVNNHYQAFADPHASGNLGGFQGGIDLLRGPLILGGHDRAGLYGAYGDVSADVSGLVTNPAATAYIFTHTGSLNLNAWSLGGYWTHVGPGGWYLNADLQGTWYGGSGPDQRQYLALRPCRLRIRGRKYPEQLAQQCPRIVGRPIHVVIRGAWRAEITPHPQ